MDRLAPSLRLATPDDIAGVDTLLSRSYPRLLKADYLPSVMVTAVPMMARARPGLLGSGRYYVAETAEGRIVAAGGWSWRDRPARVAEVRHVATDPDYLRRGIAGRLLTRVLDAARAEGGRRIVCLSTRTAVPFYRAMGFAVEGPVEITLGAGIAFPAVAMQRPL